MLSVTCYDAAQVNLWKENPLEFVVNMISIFLRSFTAIYISYPNSFPGKRLHERPTSFNFALKTNYVCLRKKAGNKQLIGQLVYRIWLE